MAKITSTIKANNIGPHINLYNKLELNKKKVAVFANNGSGKTFLSRAFRLIQDPTIEKVNNILTLGENKGEFEFIVTETTGNDTREEKIKLELNRGHEPQFTNDSKYLYHVFNSDYVRENIEAVNFLPDGEIEGYIIGKSKIDLKKEKNKLKVIQDEIKIKGASFKEQVEKGKEELDDAKVNKNTREYKFSYRDIYDNTFDYEDSKSFEELKVLNTLLGSMPDNIEDVKYPELNINTDFFVDLVNVLKTSYSLSDFSKTFKKKITPKLTFIKHGVEYIENLEQDEGQCIFCEQKLTNEAVSLIDKYVKFVNDEESKVKESIVNYIKDLNTIKTNIIKGNSSLAETKKKFDNVKKYLPSLTDTELEEYNQLDDLSELITTLQSILDDKRDNIKEKIEKKVYSKIIENISDSVANLMEVKERNESKIDELNSNKKNTTIEKRELNRRLCKSKYQELGKKLETEIIELKKLVSDKKQLEIIIEEKEGEEKKSKKSQFIESFKYYLNFFFKDKYEFDDEEFCLKFKSHLMKSNASDVLSEGEKSIIAFCNYLSDLHRIINKQADYENLFFIIDDPISSLDFHYVYSVSQIIRSLHEDLKISKSRFLIFTHNLEFMSILIRNKIVTDYYALHLGDINKINKELVMPYEEHLRDIIHVSNGTPSSHTTANSIRHVLETIQRFEEPNSDIKDYLIKHEVLVDNEYIYSLMHDSSHGIFRTQKPYSEEMIKGGCSAVVEFINSKYEGQIKQLL